MLREYKTQLGLGSAEEDLPRGHTSKFKSTCSGLQLMFFISECSLLSYHHHLLQHLPCFSRAAGCGAGNSPKALGGLFLLDTVPSALLLSGHSLLLIGENTESFLWYWSLPHQRGQPREGAEGHQSCACICTCWEAGDQPSRGITNPHLTTSQGRTSHL